ncbi:MAG: YegP family protein [Chitinophagaceae bacterium]|nr:YegP family protein [Chitinophagaceae bacterium]
MGKFVISTRSNGEYQFNLKADNGQTILSSEGYTAKAGCTNGIESVKKNSQDSSNFERKVAANGKHYFNLKATNGQVIGTSQMYESEDGMVNGLASVLKNAHNAEVVDETA